MPMDLPTKRVIEKHELVIDLSRKLDAKEFSFQYRQVLTQMEEEGVDLNYDDAFFVRINGDELVFRYRPKPKKAD